MKRYLIILLFLCHAMNFGFCQEEKMKSHYNQPYANSMLNSAIHRTTSIRAKEHIRIPYLPKIYVEQIKYIYALSESALIFDAGKELFLINTVDNSITGAIKKGPGHPEIITGEGNFFHFLTGLGFSVKESSFFKWMQQPSFPVPGLSRESTLMHFSYENNDFSFAVNMPFDYENPETFIIGVLENRRSSKWQQTYNGNIVPAPFSQDKKIVTAQENLIRIFDYEGKIKTIKLKQNTFFKKDLKTYRPSWASIGPGNLLYLTLMIDNKNYLRVYNLDGMLKWEYNLAAKDTFQPPVITNDNLVYVVSPSGIECLLDGKFIRRVHFKKPVKYPCVTALKDGSILLTKNNEIHHIMADGKWDWIYTDKNSEPFVTPPILDYAGNVVAATDKEVIILK